MPRDFLADDSDTPQESYQAMPRDFLAEPQGESKLASVALAAPRIGEDIIKSGYSAIRKIPDYYQSSKTEIPAAIEQIINNPTYAGKQATAGLAELGQNVFNTPHDIVNYLSQRLNLVPENINKMVQMGRMPSDTEGMINQSFGEANQPGAELLRGIPRNALNIGGTAGLAKFINPLRFTAGGIAKNVVKEEAKQIAQHSARYNKIWDIAEKTGFNEVPADMNALNKNFNIIEKYKTPREFNALKEFINSPTLANAQKAQSDMGVISRALEEKSRTSSLLSEEKNLYNAAKEAEKNIEGNMFKNKAGETNNSLQDIYKKLTNSYRENVVPYKYHPAIQAYKAKEMTAPELVNALSRGEFAAKKGWTHPAIKVNKLLPSTSLMGATGLTGLIGYLLGSRPLPGNRENQ